jgi:hypothetical protein
MQIDSESWNVANCSQMNWPECAVYKHMAVEVPNRIAANINLISDPYIERVGRSAEVGETGSGSVNGGVTSTVQTH